MDLRFQLGCWVRYFYRQGPRFRHLLASLEGSARYGKAEIADYQSRCLQRMVRHCDRNIPYYRQLFSDLRLRPEHIRTAADLKHLPLMDKQTVRRNFDRLIAPERRNVLCRVAATSGSTGTPGRFMRDYGAINFENAAVWRHWRAAGDVSDKRITLRGDIVVPVAQTHPPFWKYNAANRELLMSAYHLSLANARAYIDRIIAFGPSVLYAYPSAAGVLARLFSAFGVCHRFKIVFTSSESLSDEMRRLIEDAFQAPVFDWYGQAERVAALGQCRCGTYHIQEDYSLVELVESPNGCELVGTHFFNFVMPLLRYRTGDEVRPDPSDCPCGSAFRTVATVYGRDCGVLMTSDGVPIPITNHIPRGVDNLLETQFCQEKFGELTVKVVTNGRFTDHDRATLAQRVLEHTSPRMKVVVQEVDHIARGPNGKFVPVVSALAASPRQQ